MATVVYPDCTDCCVGVVTTPCCVDAIPERLYATFDMTTGDCACLEGVILTLNYNAVAVAWQSNETFCSVAHAVSLVCTINEWTISTLTNCVFGATQNSYSCSPVSIVFTGVTVTGCCTGSVRITITETHP